MAEDLGEKTEEPTPKRQREAREEGNVGKSQDLAGALLLLVATLATALLAMKMLGDAKILLQSALTDDVLGNATDPSTTWAYITHIGMATIMITAPILIVMWMASYLGTFIQVGWLIAPKGVQPKFSKLDPIKGFGRVFGMSALVKAGLDAGKVFIVVAVAIVFITTHIDRVLVLPGLTVLEALSEIGMMMFQMALWVLLVLLLLGAIDFAYQKYKNRRDMRMTKQQVKDEMKQTEGDPEVKRRRMRMAQQLAQQRIAQAVPKADVIVTNPEHYAVAIQYDGEQMPAPKVIAKGVDFTAQRIRQIAMQHDIPIVQRPPLARALYRDVEINQFIPPEFYQAVAEILAYVYRLSGRMAS